MVLARQNDLSVGAEVVAAATLSGAAPPAKVVSFTLRNA